MKLRNRILFVFLVIAMLVSLLPLQSAYANAGLQTAATTRTITLSLSDSYGDGWNGNSLVLYVDGAQYASYTISSGSSASYVIDYDMTKSYEFKWSKGSYASECSFVIKLDDKTLLTATKTECGSYTSGQSLLKLEAVHYDLEGEFAGGTGIASDPYLVATKAQLDHVRKYPDAHFRQVMDITFTASDFAVTGDYYNGGQGWEPIGNNKNPFNGYYDGNGHSITGLTITRGVTESYAYLGLFGYVYGDIANVTLEELAYTVTGQTAIYVGGVAGYVNGSTIIGCSASGTMDVAGEAIGGIVGSGYTVKYCTSSVNMTASGATWPTMGGIAGYAYTVIGCENSGVLYTDCSDVVLGGIAGRTWTTLSYCTNTGKVTADATDSTSYVQVGGIVGAASGDVNKCVNSGTVTGSGNDAYAGGIAGYYGESNTAKVLAECVNKGAVTTTSPSGTNIVTYGYAGGIVAELSGGTIRDCYVTTTVTLTTKGTGDAVAGGITALSWSGSTIRDCYSLVNSLSLNTSASFWCRGGIAGWSYSTITDSYYRYTTAVGQNDGTSSATRVSTLSSYASQSTYSGFDFTTIWQMGTGTYTYAILRMESGHTHSLTYHAATATYEASGKLEHWYCAGCDTYFRDATGTLHTTAAMLTSDPLPRTGTCGDNAIWSLTHDGVLTISGTGDVANYSDGTAPWYAYRENITTVIVQQGITGIGSYAFADCTNLVDVSLPEGVSSIGDGAFSSCGSVQQLLLPASVRSVGEEAFAFIANLIICFQGDAPTFAGANVFSGTTAAAYYPADADTWTEDHMQNYGGTVTWTAYDTLRDVTVASGSHYPVSWKLSIHGTLTVTGEYSGGDMPNFTYSSRPGWEAYQDRITALVCESIGRIGNYAFYEYPALRSIDLGSTDEIGDYAFYRCAALERAFIPGGWSSCTIGAYAFYDCSALRQVTISHRTTVGSYAFAHCTQLTEIYIGTAGTYSPTSYGLSIASNSFQNVTATAYLPVGWTVKDHGSFGGTLTWQQAKFGPCGPDAFWTYDESTSTITITGTGSIVSYSGGSYYPWYGLRADVKKVVFADGITLLPEYVFEYMDQIQTVTLPNTLHFLSCNAFNDCASLNNLLIPASITEFASYGYFNRCNSLTDVYYLGTAEEWANVKYSNVIGSSYDNVDTVHFLVLNQQAATCTEDGVEAHYRFDDTSIYAGYYDLDKQSIDQPVAVPAQGHSYENSVCRVCRAVDPQDILAQGICGDDLTWTLTQSGTLVISGTGSMYDYDSAPDSPFYDYKDSINCILLPDGITTIGDYAFAGGYGSLDHVEIPMSVTYIREVAFGTGVDRIWLKYPGTMAQWCALRILDYTYDCQYGAECADGTILYKGTCGNDAKFVLYGDGTLSITGTGTMRFYEYLYYESYWSGDDDVKKVVVGEGITSIAAYAFKNCENLESVEIAATVTSIGSNAFLNCASLTAVELPEGLTSVNNAAFQGCTNLATVQIPGSLTYIGSAAFQDCASLTGIILPDGVTRIYDNTFDGCSSLQSVQLPDGMTSIGVQAFGDCVALTQIQLPASLTKLGGYAFSGCTALTGIQIPDGVTTIEWYTFYNCRSLAEITIPASVTSIETWAFYQCESLKTITFLGNAPTFGSSVFYGVTATAYYPVGNATWTASVRKDYGGDITWVVNCAHEWQEATCTAAKTCPICGTTEGKALGHELTQYEAKAPTCTEDGWAAYETCSRCDHNTYEALSATGHNYESVVTAPTCTEPGYTTHTCANCTDVYVDSEVEATGHSYGEWYTTIEATCTTDGEERHNCANCDHYETAVIEAIGHNYETVVTAPTCTEQGCTTHTCANCDDAYVDTYVEATGHSYDQGVVTQEPTCAEEGVRTYTCANCGDTRTEVIEKTEAHSYEAIVTSPTCTKPGYTTCTCTVCGDCYTENETEALGHAFDEGVVTDAPTCVQDGKKTYTCTRCQSTKTEVIPKTDVHIYGDGVVTTAPTCTEEGVLTYTCLHCEDSFTEVIPVLSHNFEGGACADCSLQRGDANGDGIVNTTDAKLVMQFELGLVNADTLDLDVLDVNGDGEVNTTDAKLIMQIELGLIEMQGSSTDNSADAVSPKQRSFRRKTQYAARPALPATLTRFFA